MPLCHKDYSELKISENQHIQEEAFFPLNFPYLPKIRASQKNSRIINPLPRSFTTTEDRLLSPETRIRGHLDGQYHKTTLSPICSRGPFIFPESHLFSPKCCYSLPPSSIEIVSNIWQGASI